MRMLDVDGDGTRELVARAGSASVLGLPSAGGIALFDPRLDLAGRRRMHDVLVCNPPQAYSSVASPGFADVTGDGIPDAIAFSAGRVQVWHGANGKHAFMPSDAVLRSTDPGGEAFDFAPILTEDVTGDGILDVIVAFPTASIARRRSGEVCVFEGGPGLIGTPAPWAALSDPSPGGNDDLLGNIGFSNWYSEGTPGVLVADVTGDSIRDVLAVSVTADSGLTSNVGRILVWSGSALAGTPAPTATLLTKGSSKSTALGFLANHAQGLHAIDVTGDGVKDVVASSLGNTGMICVWKGGSSLSGSLDTSARLVPSIGASTQGLCSSGAWTQGLQFADLDQDGITDLVAAASFAQLGAMPDAGAIFFFRGGNLAGTVNETALLQLASPNNDNLAISALELADVTGDGVPDVVEGSEYALTSSGRRGAIHIWPGRVGLAGTVHPSTSIEPRTWGCCGSVRAPGLTLADVTGDGVLDLLATAWAATMPTPSSGGRGSGRIHFVAGGSALANAGVIAPTATLVDPATVTTEWLGRDGVRLVDFNGDGRLDVVAASKVVDTSKIHPWNEGRVLIWNGSPTLSGMPPPDVVATGGQAGEQFAYDSDGFQFDFGDVTADGNLDLLVGAPFHVGASGRPTGGTYVFAGGPAASGTLTPLALLENPLGCQPHWLGSFHISARAVDVDQDGFDDVVTSIYWAAVPPYGHAGELLWFRGPIGTGGVAPVPLAAPELGNSGLGG
jgi:hypothetical protein